MDNEWKNSLRKRFSDYSAPEPEGLWEGIEQGIAGKPRRKMLPVWIVSGVAVAAAVTLAVFLHPERTVEKPVVDSVDRYVQSMPTDTDVPADTVGTEPSDTDNSTRPEASKSVPFAVTSRQTLLSATTSVPSVPVSDETVPDAVHEVVPIVETPVSETAVPDNIPAETLASEMKETVPENVGNVVSVIPENIDNQEDISEIPKKDKTAWKRFSIGAGREGGQAAFEQSAGYGMNRTGSYLTRVTYGGQKKTSDLMEMLSNNRASTYEAHHGAPVRMGVSVAWGLSPHLSLVSGLNWTSLSSTFDERTAGDTHTSIRQNLGYLGVPLRLEAGFEPVKRLRLYAGAGGMVEKGMMSSSRTDSYFGDHLGSTVNGHPDTGGLLWSVGALAGVEFRLSRVFGLYVAPGIEYHFDNGAEARSAYTEKPLHWNVALGVRFNIGK